MDRISTLDKNVLCIVFKYLEPYEIVIFCTRVSGYFRNNVTPFLNWRLLVNYHFKTSLKPKYKNFLELTKHRGIYYYGIVQNMSLTKSPVGTPNEIIKNVDFEAIFKTYENLHSVPEYPTLDIKYSYETFISKIQEIPSTTDREIYELCLLEIKSSVIGANNKIKYKPDMFGSQFFNSKKELINKTSPYLYETIIQETTSFYNIARVADKIDYMMCEGCCKKIANYPNVDSLCQKCREWALGYQAYKNEWIDTFEPFNEAHLRKILENKGYFCTSEHIYYIRKYNVVPIYN